LDAALSLLTELAGMGAEAIAVFAPGVPPTVNNGSRSMKAGTTSFAIIEREKERYFVFNFA
jgi:crotonobetainyl-CoA:carnitine CoA-transferase CaiB-like acyl-CoA transferase